MPYVENSRGWWSQAPSAENVPGWSNWDDDAWLNGSNRIKDVSNDVTIPNVNDFLEIEIDTGTGGTSSVMYEYVIDEDKTMYDTKTLIDLEWKLWNDICRIISHDLPSRLSSKQIIDDLLTEIGAKETEIEYLTKLANEQDPQELKTRF